MEIRQIFCVSYMLWSVPVGFFLGAVYDLFRILRMTRKRGGTVDAVLAFIEDLTFALCAGVVLTLTAYLCNRGRVRFITFLPDLAGFALWRALCGRFICSFARAVIGAGKAPFVRAGERRRTKKEMRGVLRRASSPYIEKEGGPHAGKRKNVVLREADRDPVRHRVHRHDRSSADAVQRT